MTFATKIVPATLAALLASAAIGIARANDEYGSRVEVQNYAPPAGNVEIVVNPVETPAYAYDEMNQSLSAEERQGMTLNPGAGGLAATGDNPFVGGDGTAVDDFEDPDLGADIASLAGPTLFSISSGGSGGDLGRTRTRVTELSPLDTLKKRLKDLKKKQDKLDKELEAARQAFLETEAGKKTQKELDEIEKRRKAKLKKAQEAKEAKLRNMDPECCTYEQRNQFDMEKYEDDDKINEDADDEREDAFDKGMKEDDPEAQEEYEKTRDERDEVEGERREASKAKAALEEAEMLRQADAEDGPVIPDDEVEGGR